MDLGRLKRPVFLVDRTKVRRNVERMAEKARQSGVALRPHVKTHQSADVAGWLREFDVRAITVSSVDMAAYFLSAGWKDILISVPVNIHQVPEIDELAAAGTVHVIVESTAAARGLVEGVHNPLDVWIEVDSGYHRTGLPVGRVDRITQVAAVLAGNRRLRLRGLLCHDGQTYVAAGPAEVRSIAAASLEAQSAAVRALDAAGFRDLRLSIGDTPSCSLMEAFPPPVSEIRPGNFVFYDLTQSGVGACREEDIAAAVACPVIANYPERGEIVIYGGGVHISKEVLRRSDGTPSYGKIARLGEAGQGWNGAMPGAFLSSLSQEQGIIKVPSDFTDEVRIGDTLVVLPVHACLTANLHSSLFAVGENWLSKFRF